MLSMVCLHFFRILISRCPQNCKYLILYRFTHKQIVRLWCHSFSFLDCHRISRMRCWITRYFFYHNFYLTTYDFGYHTNKELNILVSSTTPHIKSSVILNIIHLLNLKKQQCYICCKKIHIETWTEISTFWRHFQMHFLKDVSIWNQISLKLVPMYLIDVGST